MDSHLQELADIVKDAPAPQHRLDNATEVVILHSTATVCSQAMPQTMLLIGIVGANGGGRGGGGGGGGGRRQERGGPAVMLQPLCLSHPLCLSLLVVDGYLYKGLLRWVSEGGGRGAFAQL